MQTQEIYKGTGFVGAGFNFLDTAPEVITRKPVQVGFFKDFFNPVSTPIKSRVYQLKEVITPENQEATGKSYSDLIGALTKNTANLYNFNVGSFGLGWAVSPSDIQGKISPVTGEPMTVEEVIATMQLAAQKAWDNTDEKAIAQLITTDTCFTGGFAGNPSYNWYTELVGSSRPAATSMNLAGSVDHVQLFQNEVDGMLEEADKYGLSTTFRPVVLCGATFYANRLTIERQEGLARELHGAGPDLQSAERPFASYGGMRHAYFDGHDGVRYIRVNQSIGGTKSIAATSAFMVPEGVQIVQKVYAPAQSMAVGNGFGAQSYAWEQVSDRTGVVRHEESNFLFVNPYPRMIRNLTV